MSSAGLVRLLWTELPHKYKVFAVQVAREIMGATSAAVWNLHGLLMAAHQQQQPGPCNVWQAATRSGSMA